MKIPTIKYTQAVRLTQEGLLKKIIFTDFWEVKVPFIWYIDYASKTMPIIVPVGFKTDFGSIPRILWFLLNPTKYVAYVLHDFTYSSKGPNYTRKQADMILLEAMTVEGAKVWEKILVYIGVRSFGWLFFKK